MHRRDVLAGIAAFAAAPVLAKESFAMPDALNRALQQSIADRRIVGAVLQVTEAGKTCLLYTSPSPRD